MGSFDKWISKEENAKKVYYATIGAMIFLGLQLTIALTKKAVS